MSDDDDNAPMQGPVPSAGWMEKHQERLVSEEKEREAQTAAIRQADEDLDTALTIADIKAVADRRIAWWQQFACNGDRDKVAACTPDVRAGCSRNQYPACPRLGIEADRRELRHQMHELGCGELSLMHVFDVEPEETEALRLLRGIPDAPLIVLSGGVGCGKTCAATVWAIERKARMLTAHELACISPYETNARTLERHKAMVLDDLGTEFLDAKGFFSAHLDSLINRRHAAQRQTLITTNMSVDTFRQRYGARVADRIREAGHFLQVSGPSLRRRT